MSPLFVLSSCCLGCRPCNVLRDLVAAKMSVFVTVGTTSFDALCQSIDNEAFLELTQQLGYGRVLLQIGRGSHEPALTGGGDDSLTPRRAGSELEFYRFKDTLAADIAEASLIISHAGRNV